MNVRSFLTPTNRRNAIEKCLLVAAGAYALLYLHVDALVSPLTTLLSLSAVFMVATRQPCTRHMPLLKLFYIVVLWQLIVWGYNNYFYPEFGERSPKVERMAAWFMLLPIAFITSKRMAYVFSLWFVAVVAIIAAPWLSGNGLSEILRGIEGRRVAFGVRNAQHMGALFGVVLLGLSLFSVRIFAYTKKTGHYWIGIGLLLIWFYSVAGVVFTQTRAVWLAILVTMACTSLWWLVAHIRNIKSEGETKPLAAYRNIMVIVLVLLVSFPLLFVDVVQNKLDKTKNYDWAAILHDPAASKDGSIRVRYMTWVESLTWIKERPLTGWGRKGSGAVVAATPDLKASEKKQIRHLHNSYLDITVNYGLVGLLLFFSLLYLISKRINSTFAKDAANTDIVLFWNMFLIYWLVVNMFESYVFYSTGTYIFALVAGGLLGLTFSKGNASEIKSSGARTEAVT